MDNKIEENEKVEENSEVISDSARDIKLSELEILQQSLDEKKKLAEDYYGQLIRLRAEFDNYRRRSEKEKQNHLIWGKEEILLKQVGLYDVLEQASQSANTSNNIESIQKGIQLIKQEFAKMLSSEGIIEIESLGKKFDPNFHDAVDQIESEESDGIILEVLQKGYILNGRVIRPSKVRVSKNITNNNNNEEKLN